MDDLVSLSKATELLKFDGDSRGRKLKRRLRQKEAEVGVTLIEETEGGQDRVSLKRLALLCPDLCPSKERDLEKRITQRFREFERSIDARVTSRFLELEGNLTKSLLARIAKIEERLPSLDVPSRETAPKK